MQHLYRLVFHFLFLKTAKVFTENYNVWLNAIAFVGGYCLLGCNSFRRKIV